jgi:hypothetical protein
MDRLGGELVFDIDEGERGVCPTLRMATFIDQSIFTQSPTRSFARTHTE